MKQGDSVESVATLNTADYAQLQEQMEEVLLKKKNGAYKVPSLRFRYYRIFNRGLSFP